MNVPERLSFVNITSEVERAVADSGVAEGLCLVNAMHITASVFINDDEPGLHEDYTRWLEWLAPYDPSPERYHHNRTGEDNGGCAPQAPSNGPRSGGGRHQRKARFRTLGADLLRGVRRPPEEAG